MDIEYLLFLQNFRNSINDALTPLMEFISFFAVRWAFLLPAFLYWCINKKKGLYVLTSLSVSLWINAVIKLTACVYRPWIRDPRIIPAGDSIKTAGGYSFPSGHTMTATPIYGGFAVCSKNTFNKIFWIILILLTGFSRNYLGVHTPQDVLVGLIGGAFALYVVAKIFKYLDDNPQKENLFLLIGVVLCAAAIVYTKLKSYPMDYDVNGKLLVKPESMQNGSLGDLSYILGLVLGRYVEKNWIKFTPTGINFKGIILSVIGLAIYAYIIFYVKDFIFKAIGVPCGRVVYSTISMFFVVALYPLIIKMFSKKRD